MANYAGPERRVHHNLRAAIDIAPSAARDFMVMKIRGLGPDRLREMDAKLVGAVELAEKVRPIVREADRLRSIGEL